jgi:hypothetical protein
MSKRYVERLGALLLVFELSRLQRHQHGITQALI